VTRPRIGLLTLAAVTLAGVVAGLVLLARDDAAPEAGRSAGGLERCSNLLADRAQTCYTREYQRLVEAAERPDDALRRISRAAYAAGGSRLADCHGLMHTVGRRYVCARGVTVATLMAHLPKSNDPGCTAGFAHGVVTGVAPQIDLRRPRAAVAVCGRAGTRFQRYSCTHGFGHAFMRIYDDRLEPALGLCSALGRRAAPDCAQGAYHDYWFAVIGADETRRPEAPVTSPRQLCSTQRPEFVRPCWYRAFIDTRPPGFQTGSPADLERLCAGLAGVQRAGCITAASVIGPADPALQLALCAGGLAAADAVSCIHGTKVQNILEYPLSSYLELIGGCDAFAGTTRSACYRWLGKTLAVITDGRFGRSGCPRLATRPLRRACSAGARSMDEALVTFS
jgi:hypothetical protein